MITNTYNSSEESNKYFDSDSPIGRYKLCYPNKEDWEVEKAVNKYRRRLYNRYISGDTSNMSTSQMQELAIKKSFYSNYELDILIVHYIEDDFRIELSEMYTLSMDIIDNTSIAELHNLTKDFELIEEAYGKRVKAQPEDLTDSTLYKNKNDRSLSPR